MLRFNLRSYFGKADVEPDKPRITDRFAQVMARISLEYDLSPDVWAAAEDVLQALKAREGKWALSQAEKPA